MLCQIISSHIRSSDITHLDTSTCPRRTAYMRAVDPSSLVMLMVLMSRATRKAAISA